MAVYSYDTTDNVSVGEITKKSHYDQLLDNSNFIKYDVLHTSGDAGERAGADGSPFLIGAWNLNAIASAENDNDIVGMYAAQAGDGGAGFAAYGRTAAGSPHDMSLFCGHTDDASSTSHLIKLQERNSVSTKTLATFSTAEAVLYSDTLRREATGTLNLLPHAGTFASNVAGLQISGTGDTIFKLGSSATGFLIQDYLGAVRHYFYNDGEVRHLSTTKGIYSYYLEEATLKHHYYVKSGGTTKDGVVIDCNSTTSPYIRLYESGVEEGYISTSSGGDIIISAGGDMVDMSLSGYLRVPQSTSTAAKTFGEIRWRSTATAGQELQCYDGTAWRYIALTATS